MVVALFRHMVGVLGMLLIVTSALAQTPPASYPIDSIMRHKDTRLDALVTLHADRMYLGEFLENLTAKTNVSFSTDLTDSFSGLRITCDLKQAPLAHVMNALWSLVGFKNAVWEWNSDARQGLPRYHFRPTRAASTLPDRLNQEMQEAFEAQAELMIQIASMSPKERQESTGKLAASMLLDDLKVANGYVDPNSGLDRFWAAIRLFAALVPPDQRTRIWRGEIVDIPLASLNESDRQLAVKLGGKNITVVNGNNRQEFPPDTIRFKSTRYFGNTKDISMRMFIYVGSKAGFQGMSYFGMLTFGLLARAYEGWILPGDQRALDVEMSPISALMPVKSDDTWSMAPALDHDVAQVAAAEGVSFLAVIPEYTGFQLPDAIGKTSKQHFAELWKGEPYLMHKWREGILLANYPTWFYGDDAQYPYGIVQRLRTRLRSHEGQLTLDDVAEPVTTLKEAQWKRLSQEFPAFQNAPSMMPVATFYKHYPQSLSANGIPVDLKMQAFMKEAGLWPSPLQEDERITSARILDELRTLNGTVRHIYHLQLVSSKQKWTDIAACWIAHVTPKSPD